MRLLNPKEPSLACLTCARELRRRRRDLNFPNVILLADPAPVCQIWIYNAPGNHVFSKTSIDTYRTFAH